MRIGFREAVTALVRDPGKARQCLATAAACASVRHDVNGPGDLTEALDGIRTVFIADGFNRGRGCLAADRDQCRSKDLLDRAGRPSVGAQRSPNSRGLNQRAHNSIDQFAYPATAVPYSTIRPAIFSASLLTDRRVLWPSSFTSTAPNSSEAAGTINYYRSPSRHAGNWNYGFPGRDPRRAAP